MSAHRLDADDPLDFDSFASPPHHDKPYVGLWRLGMDRAMTRRASELGGTTMMTGIGADEMLDVQPIHITDLLRSGPLGEAWSEAALWARSDNVNVWRILYPFGLANLAVVRRLETLTRRSTVLARQSDWSIPPWVDRGFARRHHLRDRADGYGREIYRSAGRTGLSFALHSITSRVGDVTRWTVADPLGLTIAHPFLDPRVLRLGLAIQGQIQAKPGRLKPILAEATRGLLPESIRIRRRKGQFNEVY